jgi:hypothetical protein
VSGGAPDVTATRRNGTLKYGFGMNAEQEITGDIGVFARLGWNDGKTESFAFTAIDRLATELTASGISGVHALYLARGGYDFLIGDGRLRYGPEYVSETYYSVRVFPGVFASLDLQHVSNPAYNRDRGTVWIPSLRFHIESRKEHFRRERQAVVCRISLSPTPKRDRVDPQSFGFEAREK